jgi:transcriptional regulator with XRE-family HTH domain
MPVFGRFLKYKNNERYAILIERLKVLRKESGITQSELATRIGRDQTYISKIEGKQRRIDVIELQSFCEALGVDVLDFLEDIFKYMSKTNAH